MAIKNTFISATLISVVSVLSMAQSAVAGTSCQPIYGGGQTCVTTNLQINKMVLNPQTNLMVNSLDINSPKYDPQDSSKSNKKDLVTFTITVTNVGNTQLQNILVRDFLPGEVTLATGDTSYTIASLNPNQSDTKTIQARVVPSASLPANQGIVCTTNRAQAIVGSENQTSDSSFCIEKTVLGAQQPQPTAAPTTKGGKVVFPAPFAKTTPPTGPEALSLLALLPTGLFGYLIRKKSIQS